MPRGSSRRGGYRTLRAVRTAAALLCALGAGLLAAALPAAPATAARWETFDWALPDRIRVARLVRWHGRPAILASSPTRAEGGPATLVQVLVLGPSGVQAAVSFAYPGGIQWAEPIHLPGGREGWLALRPDGWYLGGGTAAPGDLAWRRVCACPSVFNEKEDPDALGPPFAFDVNGDGVDELVSPDPEGVTVYRWVGDSDLLEPWWRYRWEEPLLRDPKRPSAWQLPYYWLLDTHRAHTLDLVLHHADHLAVYPFPEIGPPHYRISGAARVRLESAAVPAPLRKALTGMIDGDYPDAQSLIAAVPLPADPRQRANSMAALPVALWALQDSPQTLEPSVMPLPGAPKLHAGDYAFAVALEDLTGNGYVDLLQAAVRGDNSALGVRGELRLYTGAERDRRWAIPDPAVTIATSGAAVAEFFRPATGPDAPGALVVASTEASLAAILRSLSSGKMRVDLSLHLLKDGKFNPKADQRTRMEMEDVASGARPLVLAADLDGDGWRELMISRRPDDLLVFAGAPTGPRLAAAPLEHLKGPLPRKPQEAFVADLDGSGREALVFWYRSGRYNDTLRRTLRFVRWVD